MKLKINATAKQSEALIRTLNATANKSEALFNSSYPEVIAFRSLTPPHQSNPPKPETYRRQPKHPESTRTSSQLQIPAYLIWVLNSCVVPNARLFGETRT